MLLGNGVLYEWCNVPSLKKLSRLRGSSGYNYFMSRWLGFFGGFFKIKKNRIFAIIQKNVFNSAASLFPKQLIPSSSHGVECPKTVCKEALLLVAVFVMMRRKSGVPLIFYFLWVIKFISKSTEWWNAMKEPGQRFKKRKWTSLGWCIHVSVL